MNTALLALREQIDAVDRELLTLLNRRAGLALEVGEIKKHEGSPVFRPEREAQVIEGLKRDNVGPLKNDSIAPIWRELMSACRSLESASRVAFLGPAGTFSEQAALGYFGSSIERVPCASIDEVFRATSAGAADFGVVPVENSTEGVVARSLDLFLHTPLTIMGETSLLVRHNLLRKTASREGITAVLAHPQALAQCQAWLSLHLPQAERRPVSSNAEGARLASLDESVAGIASDRAATEFGLHVVPNRPGAVHDMLVPLKAHGVSMTRFESRPARSGQWEYYFYIDIAGHPDNARVATALSELRGTCAFFKVLGTYPVDTH